MEDAAPAPSAASRSSVLVASVALEPVPIAGFVAANVVAPLLACGLLYASLAADRGDRPRIAHLVAVFAAPLPAQVAVVAAGLVPVAAEIWIAAQVAGVNLALPAAGSVAAVGGRDPRHLRRGHRGRRCPSRSCRWSRCSTASRSAACSRCRRARSRSTFRALGAYACIAFALLLVGIATSGVALVLVLPWIAAASYAAWKDVFGVK